MDEPATPSSMHPSVFLEPPNLEALDGTTENITTSKPARKTRRRGTDANTGATPKKATPKKERFTSNRHKATREVRKPGDSSGKTYIKVYEYEGECAAYCGFTDVADFRAFVLNPYVLKFYNMLYPIIGSARRVNALQLLYDIKTFNEHWSGDDEPEQRYPADQHPVNVHYQMAYIAVKLVTSLQKGLFTENDARSARTTYKQLTGNTLPEPPALKNLTLPHFGPFDGETSVEPYNRALNVLLYIQFSNNKSNWKNRFGNKNWAASKKLRENDKPDWMRQHAGSRDPVDGLPDEPLPITEGDQQSLKPVDATVIWFYQAEDTPQKEYIDWAKQEHKELFVAGKPKKAKATVVLDPRMTREMFRDEVRVAFEMPATGAQIYEMWQEDEELTPLDDVDWDELMQTLLETPSKALFNLLIQRREPQDSVFEYEGPPLLLKAHL